MRRLSARSCSSISAEFAAVSGATVSGPTVGATVFTDAQKTDIRRFCGYPAYGADDAGNMSFRFYTAYGTLEYRMNNFSPAEVGVVLNQLTILYTLEAAVPAAGGDLDTSAAGAWTRNAGEVGERLALLDAWRRRLCGFIGVPPGEALGSAGVRWIV